MQQTEKYALNLIETSDPFSPAALNENAQKTEAALTALAAADQTEASARAAADTALKSRVTALEAKRIVAGIYQGGGAAIDISLGFRPFAVILCNSNESLTVMHTEGLSNGQYWNLTDDGFHIDALDNRNFNNKNQNWIYYYIAFG